MTFETKDSGKRVDYASGMRRDTDEGKPRYDLVDRPMLKRWAELMGRGAEKYGEENWRQANSEEEAKRFQASALRHMMQWLEGERDEDHAAAVLFNIAAYEYVTARRGPVYVLGLPEDLTASSDAGWTDVGRVVEDKPANPTGCASQRTEHLREVRDMTDEES